MHQNNVTVSIGMPVYNGEKFIEQALDCLLEQTFTDFELIISDNASTDATESICRNYANRDSRIKYFRQDENLGALRNFQFVLDESVGEYFMWAACDDKWHIDWIASLYKKLELTKNSAVFGKLIQIDEFSRVIPHPATTNQFHFSGSVVNRKISFFLEFEGKGKANLFYCLFKRKNLENINFLEYEQDYYALFDLLNNVSFLSIDDVFLYKRIHSNGEGVAKSKSLFLKISNVLTLKTIVAGFNNAMGYLKYSHGSEKIIIIILIPIKVVLDHIFHIKSIFTRFL
jgi:glycosyltransferase involved in cell wall biosynthesis